MPKYWAKTNYLYREMSTRIQSRGPAVPDEPLPGRTTTADQSK
jgi:hypothetical protein